MNHVRIRTKNFILFFLAAFAIMAAFFCLPVRALAATKAEIVQFSAEEIRDSTVSGGSVVSGSSVLFRFNWKTKGFSKKKDAQVKIYATNRKLELNGTLIWQKYTKANGSVYVSVDKLQTGCYYFYITVSDGSREVSKQYSEMFYIGNPLAPPELFLVDAVLIDNSINIYWDDEKKTDKDLYWAGLYSTPEGRFIRTEYVQKDEVTIELPENTEGLYFCAAKMENSRRGEFTLYPLPDTSSPDVDVTFKLDGKLTNQDVLPADIEYSGPCLINVSVNGNDIITDSDAIGRYNIPLNEGANKVVVTVKDADTGNIRHFNFDPVLDTTPPELVFDDDYNGAVTTAAQVEITGKTEKGAALIVGDEEEEVSEDGSFDVPVVLKKGANVIDISASDEAGNVTYTAMMINRKYVQKNRMNKKIALLVGAFFGAIMLGYIICFIGWLRKHLDKKNGRK